VSDPSAWSVALGFIAFFAFAGFLYLLGAGLARAASRPRPTPPNAAPVSTPPHAPGRATTTNQCGQTGCAYPGLMWVIVADSFGGGVRRVCIGCHNEGAMKGWWRKSLGANASALDFQIEDEMADVARIEDFANGETP